MPVAIQNPITGSDATFKEVNNKVALDVDVTRVEGTTSLNNSTTTNLGIDAVFTGTSDDIKDYAAVSVSIFTDQASATNGLSLEWSQDGTNWDERVTVSIGANKVESYEFGIRARYFRIVYTNGGIAQGVFRLQVIFHPVRTREGARCLCVDIDNREFAPTRRAVIAGQKPNNDYTNIQATTAGNLKMAIEEFNGTASLPSGNNMLGYIGVTPSGTFNVVDLQTVPTNVSKNNPIYKFEYIVSGTANGVTGSSIGSIYQFIGTGSYAQSLTYVNDMVTQTSSWVVL